MGKWTVPEFHFSTFLNPLCFLLCGSGGFVPLFQIFSSPLPSSQLFLLIPTLYPTCSKHSQLFRSRSKLEERRRGPAQTGNINKTQQQPVILGAILHCCAAISTYTLSLSGIDTKLKNKSRFVIDSWFHFAKSLLFGWISPLFYNPLLGGCSWFSLQDFAGRKLIAQSAYTSTIYTPGNFEEDFYSYCFSHSSSLFSNPCWLL